MINIIIAFDNQNTSLGRYFDDCQRDITNLLAEHSHLLKSCSIVPSSQCNVAYIDFTVPLLNPNPFLFISYNHGAEDSLKCAGISFVTIENCHHFTNSFFYSTACLIGKKLAPELIRNGCKTFIGFKETTEVFEHVSYRQTFIQCDNFALKMFITSEATVGESFEAMKNYYTNQIDYFMELGEDINFISALSANREALVCFGDKDLKKEHLFVE